MLPQLESQDINTMKSTSMSKTWKPYYLSTWAGMRQWLAIRNWFRYPLQRTLFHVNGSSFTVGEVLILGIVVGLCILQCINSMNERLKETGALPTYLLALTFATAARNSVLSFLLGLPFERALFWHKSFAILAVLSGAFPHAWSFFKYELAHGGIDIDEDSLSGLVLLGAMFLLLATAPIRRYFFGTFLVLHLLLLITAAIFAALHGAGAALIGVGLWFADVLFRYGYSVAFANPSKAQLTKVSENVVKVSILAQTCNFSAGQYMFVCIPQLGFFEWHPFSVCVDDNDNSQVAFYVKALGDWTRRLSAFVDENGADVTVKILCEGPYGSPRLDVEGERYSNFCLVSGGIGVTPNAFMAHRLLEEKQLGRPIEGVRFCWSARSKDHFAIFGKSLASWVSKDCLSVKLFCKEESQGDVEGRAAACQNDKRLQVVQDRMNLVDELTEMAQTIDSKSPSKVQYVAVLVCGPESLEKAALRACKTCSTNNVKFHFQHETFTF